MRTITLAELAIYGATLETIKDVQRAGCKFVELVKGLPNGVYLYYLTQTHENIWGDDLIEVCELPDTEAK